MAELGFEVVLRTDVRLLIDRLDESIEQDVALLRERINGVLKEIDYNPTSNLLVNDMDKLLKRIVPSGIGEVELSYCEVIVNDGGDDVYITGLVEFNTPQYVGKTGNTINVSVPTSRELAEWYLTWLRNHEIIEAILTTKRNYGFRLMFGFRDFDSKATITHGV